MTVILFFLDKDIDDYTHSFARSEHVVYTQWYSIENYLYREGCLRTALISAAYLDSSQVIAGCSGSSVDWTHQAAESWFEWIVFCVYVKSRGLNNPNFGMKRSPIHPVLHGPVDAASLASLQTAVRTNQGLTPAQFDIEYAKVERAVRAARDACELDRFFAGKWYIIFFENLCNQIAGSDIHNEHALAEKTLSSLLSTVNYAAPWSLRFIHALAFAAGYL